MPNELALTLGQTTVRVPIKLTALQARAVLRRYALRRGMQTEGRTEVQVAEDVLRALLRIVRDTAIDQQRMEALAAQQAALEATLQSDNDLYDEPAPP
jgi:hypothetical protein